MLTGLCVVSAALTAFSEYWFTVLDVVWCADAAGAAPRPLPSWSCLAVTSQPPDTSADALQVLAAACAAAASACGHE